MRIVFFETEGWEPDALQTLCHDHEVEFTRDRLSSDNVQAYKDADIISPFVHSTLDRSLLEQFGQLKSIATRSTGFDHIDLDYCAEKSVTVTNVPVYGTNTVAEHTFALLLSISRHILDAANGTRKGDFSGSGLRGFDLYGKTLGVIGTGNIGKRVAEIANGFGMHVLAYDIQPDEDFARQQSITYVQMDSLLAQADCVTLHVPGGDSTSNLLSDPEFTQMKKGVVVINTARGSVIDVQALLRALANGRVAAAGLDVLPDEAAMKAATESIGEPQGSENDALLANQALLRTPNVIVTPHNAFNTTEAVERILQTTAENIEHFIAGSPQNTVSSK